MDEIIGERRKRGWGNRENLTLNFISPRISPSISPHKKDLDDSSAQSNNSFRSSPQQRRCPRCKKIHPLPSMYSGPAFKLNAGEMVWDAENIEASRRVTAARVFRRFYDPLIKSLPMNNITFVRKLCTIGGNRYAKSDKSFHGVDKATDFLDTVIKSSVLSGDGSCFHKLISVMENSEYSHLQELAKMIASDLKDEDLDSDNG